MKRLNDIELLNLSPDQEFLVSGLCAGLLDARGFWSNRRVMDYQYRYDPVFYTMIALDEAIVGYGVESIPEPGKSHGSPLAGYVNMGDTYTATVLYDLASSEYQVSSWGDFYEGWLEDQAENWENHHCQNCGNMVKEEDMRQDGHSDHCPSCDYAIFEYDRFTLHYWTTTNRYRLKLRDTQQLTRPGLFGKVKVQYELSDQQGVIFTGDDLGASPLHDPESKETAASLLTFLTLREGDIENDYFAEYTPRQLDFRDNEAEAVSMWQWDLEEEE